MLYFRAQWSIALAERPVMLNARADLRVLGQYLSHPFLVMRDEAGAVMSEIHGTWDKTGGRYVPGRLVDQFTAACRNEKVTKIASILAYPVRPQALIVEKQGMRDFARATVVQPLLTASQSVILGAWRDVVGTFDELNNQKMPFYRYARPGSGFANCQVMLNKAMQETGWIAGIPPLRLGQTGWTASSKPAISLAL